MYPERGAGGGPVVLADGLGAGVPGFTLTGLSFTLPRGVVLGVVGPESSGKTLLLQVLAGLRSHDNGSLRVVGADPRLANLHVKSRVALATGRLRAWSRLTPMQILTTFADLDRAPIKTMQRRIGVLVDELQLVEVADIAMESLPDDVLMRVDVARALVGDPDLALLDLTPSVIESFSFQTLLRRLIREGRSVVIAGREHRAIAGVADTMLGLDAGRQVPGHALEVLYGPPRRWRIQTPDPRLALAKLSAPTVATVVRDHDLIIDLRNDVDPTVVLRGLLRSGVPIDSFQPAEPAAEQRLREQELR